MVSIKKEIQFCVHFCLCFYLLASENIIRTSTHKKIPIRKCSYDWEWLETTARTEYERNMCISSNKNMLLFTMFRSFFSNKGACWMHLLRYFSPTFATYFQHINERLVYLYACIKLFKEIVLAAKMKKQNEHTVCSKRNR